MMMCQDDVSVVWRDGGCVVVMLCAETKSEVKYTLHAQDFLSDIKLVEYNFFLVLT